MISSTVQMTTIAHVKSAVLRSKCPCSSRNEYEYNQNLRVIPQGGGGNVGVNREERGR